MRPLRTFAFAPGSDARKLEKACGLPADAVIFDLEDAVALPEKDQARRLVREALLQPRLGRGFVRVNALPTGLLAQDLEGVLCSRLDGVVLPKAESAEEVRQVDLLLREGEKRRGLPPGGIELMPLVESAAGVYRAAEIAGACSRITRLCFGAIDFTLDVGAQWDAEGSALFYARSALVIASRVAGVEAPVDTVFPDLNDDEGLAADARLGRRLGFQGKLVIHPRQIKPVNEAFSPSSEEVAQARRIIRAFDQAQAEGVASIQVDGKMVDTPVAERARRTVEIAEAISRG